MVIMETVEMSHGCLLQTAYVVWGGGKVMFLQASVILSTVEG